MKHNCKVRLAKYVKQHNNIEIDTSSLFDVQIKRIHEYKRQFMNALYVVHRYLQLKQMTQDQRKTTVKRTIFFAGKAAPAYTTAKRIIKLINCISETVNNDE
jgi:starch phosphorylase